MARTVDSEKHRAKRQQIMHAAAGLFHHGERRIQLLAAIAPLGAEHVPGQAL